LIKYSDHAQEQMVARGISREQVEEAIKRGSIALQKPNKMLFAYKYYVVVAKKYNDTHYVITVKPRW